MIPSNHAYIQKLGEELKKEGIDVSYMKSFHYSTPFNFIKTVFLRLFGYNIIHIHWVYVFPFVFLMKLYVKFSKVLGYKIVWTIHNIHSHEYDQKDILKSRWFYNNVDYKFIHYKSNIDILKKTLEVDEKNLKVIYLPSFEEVYPNDISKADARKKLGIPLDKKIALCFGQIRTYKGVDIFQEAVELLDDEYYGLIVGEIRNKELFKQIKIASAGNSNIMIVPRRVSDEEVQIYLNACDVVVAPYRDITTSGVASLAYAFSRPFISTNKGCIPEVIEDEKTGLILNDNTPESVANAIKKIFTMDYQKMGNDACAFSKQFNWQGLKDNTIEVYKKVLDKT